MKYISLLLLSLLVISCSHRKEYKADTYQKMQLEYENEKAELTEALVKANVDKEKLFKDNKSELIKLVKLVDKLKNSKTNFENVNTDTTYTKKDVLMYPINFGLASRKKNKHSNIPMVNAIFIEQGVKSSNKESKFRNYLESLKSCLASEDDNECLQIKSDKMQNFLDIKYAFVVKKMMRTEPKLMKEGFEGGMYIANIICYDIKQDKPIYSFLAMAGNSEQIRVNEQYNSARTRIKEDFEINIKKGILEACREHFVFVDDISFMNLIF